MLKHIKRRCGIVVSWCGKFIQVCEHRYWHTIL